MWGSFAVRHHSQGRVVAPLVESVSFGDPDLWAKRPSVRVPGASTVVESRSVGTPPLPWRGEEAERCSAESIFRLHVASLCCARPLGGGVPRRAYTLP